MGSCSCTRDCTTYQFEQYSPSQCSEMAHELVGPGRLFREQSTDSHLVLSWVWPGQPAQVPVFLPSLGQGLEFARKFGWPHTHNSPASASPRGLQACAITFCLTDTHFPCSSGNPQVSTPTISVLLTDEPSRVTTDLDLNPTS